MNEIHDQVLAASCFWLGGFLWLVARAMFADLPMWAFVLLWTVTNAIPPTFRILKAVEQNEG